MPPESPSPSQPTMPPADREDAARLATRFRDLLLDGKRHEATRLILDAAAGGVPLKTLYLEVFQPSQISIGELWERGAISVAQEHFCTAATQVIMAQLYPYVFQGDRRGLSLLATCIGGELHEIGIRMVADIFEVEGWSTCFLGASSPTDAILAQLEEQRPHVLAISTTMAFHLARTRDLIQTVRQHLLPRQPRILVGGHLFNLSERLWESVGADGYAPDAVAAVQVASALYRAEAPE